MLCVCVLFKVRWNGWIIIVLFQQSTLKVFNLTGTIHSQFLLLLFLLLRIFDVRVDQTSYGTVCMWHIHCKCHVGLP